MDTYREEIIDHYKNPRNFGDLENASVRIVESNSSCGDMVEVALVMENGTVKDVKWRGVGCAISTASMSMLSEKIMGMKKEEVEKISEKEIAEMLGGEINPGRIKCATLGLRAVGKAIV